jgi:hypothetical protein
MIAKLAACRGAFANGVEHVSTWLDAMSRTCGSV